MWPKSLSEWVCPELTAQQLLGDTESSRIHTPLLIPTPFVIYSQRGGTAGSRPHLHVYPL